jgi:hypothetical protein
MAWAGHVAYMKESRELNKFWSENIKGRKRLPARPTGGWEESIKIHFQEIGCGLDSGGLRWGPVAVSYEHGNNSAPWRQITLYWKLHLDTNVLTNKPE